MAAHLSPANNFLLLPRQQSRAPARHCCQTCSWKVQGVSGRLSNVRSINLKVPEATQVQDNPFLVHLRPQRAREWLQHVTHVEASRVGRAGASLSVRAPAPYPHLSSLVERHICCTEQLCDLSIFALMAALGQVQLRGAAAPLAVRSAGRSHSRALVPAIKATGAKDTPSVRSVTERLSHCPLPSRHCP